MVKQSKYAFVLTNLDIKRINSIYGITTTDISESTEADVLHNTTRLSELNINKSTPEIISFMDESKKPHSCNLSMIDFNAGKDVNLLRYCCYWCKNPFETRPIGCPIKYIPNQAVKRYYSHISKDTYTIKENITDEGDISDNGDVDLKRGDYYETDGVFCSFNCCSAYIQDNKHNSTYNNSMHLLRKIYTDITGIKNTFIVPAPSWRTLDQYGGFMNIVKFREGFNKIEYHTHGTYRDVKFHSVGTMYEETIKF